MSETLYSLLQRAAKKHGDRAAVRFEGRTLSYSELLEASDRLGSLLRRHEAEPGCRIAFCFRKSIDALIALFAIIRTGATYVPLDASWPADRIATICGEAAPRLWLGTRSPHCPTPAKVAIVSDTDADHAIPIQSAQQCEKDEAAPAAPRNGVANILYTSGSTGRPKGVEITTRSLLHFSAWAVDAFGLRPTDRLANHAPYHFDLSTLDIFAAVRAGATLCPVPEKIKMFPYQMAEFIAEREITIWYSVPSALVMMHLRGRLADHDLSRLRHVIFAGEVMPKPVVQALARQLSGALFTNLYGPTETNVCTYHRIGRQDLETDDAVPIGRPITDTRLWIVDEHGHPVEDGSAGELWVAGPTVSCGYFLDEALTTKRLTGAPDGQGMAYRTGDRVRRRGDGTLLFEGRLDRMIKRSGHRVEPGEIEAVLGKHPDVREAAVVPIPDPVFGHQIRACVVPRRSGELQESALVAFCRDRLPSYALPDQWHFLESLPRTDREKVDLQALMRSV